MKKLTIREARQSLSHLDRLLAVEEEVMITRRGEPIAKVVQVGRKRPIPSHRDLREGMKRIHKGSETILRKDRNER
jgi:antitoxin (DNA-binding transcriptional repressor) of toxin-antitoxin stability system